MRKLSMAGAGPAEENIGTAGDGWDVENDDPHLRHLIVTYLHRLVKHTPPDSRLAHHICHFMERNYFHLSGLENVFPISDRKRASRRPAGQKRDMALSFTALPPDSADPLVEGSIEARGPDSKSGKKLYALEHGQRTIPSGARLKDWASLKAYLSAAADEATAQGESTLLRNAGLLSDHLEFSAEERDALTLVLAATENGQFAHFLHNLSRGEQSNAHGIASRMLGINDRARVSALFGSGASLTAKGILMPVSASQDMDETESFSHILPSVSSILMAVLKEPDLTIERLMKHFVGEATQTDLDWDRDFTHLGERGAEMIRVLEGVRSGDHTGVNLLLYGHAGTGKTEAFKAAAKKAGLELYVPSQGSRNNSEPTRQERLSALTLAQQLLAHKKGAALLADEMDDIFPARQSLAKMFGMAGGEAGADASKLYLNGLLENNPTPTLWTANNPNMDLAFQRRILFSIRMDIPPRDVRAKMWDKVALRHDFALSAQEAFTLTEEFVVPPGQMDNAVSVAKISGGGVPSIRHALRAAARLMHGTAKAFEVPDGLSGHYDPRLLNPSVENSEFDLAKLTDIIAESGKRDFSLFCHGEPGTGKSSYLKFMAERLDMETLVCDTSTFMANGHDNVAESVRALFAEAEERNLFLIIRDDAMLTRNRSSMRDLREVTAAKTLMSCMAAPQNPVGLTSAPTENIDPSVRRSALFSVAFRPMMPDHARAAYQHFFGRKSPDKLPQGLVVADFVKVGKRAAFLKATEDDQLARMLGAAAEERRDASVTPPPRADSEPRIGFSATLRPRN